MFTTVRYFIKTSITFLVLGILAGAYASVSANIFHEPVMPGFISAHTHVIIIGSIMMMIMGVALWFFPRAEKEDTKYNPDRIKIIYWLMTVSTGGRFVCQIANSFLTQAPLGVLIVLFSIGQGVGMVWFFYSIWGRIRAVGSQYREAKGEKF